MRKTREKPTLAIVASLLFSLLSLCLTSCSLFIRPKIIFPLEGARLNNPVYVEAEGVVNWYVDGVFVDKAKSWRGWLSEGRHEIKGATYSAIHIDVLEDFPLGQVRSFNAAEAPFVKLPDQGKFAIVLGNSKLTSQDIDLDTAFTAPPELPMFVWHMGLREKELKTTEAKPVKLEPLKTQALPEIGSKRDFHLLSFSGSGSDSIEAELLYTGDHSLVYVETSKSLNLDLLKPVIDAFEGHIYERVGTLFGGHSDVDANARVILLFSPKLNESKKAIGYFYAADLFANDAANPDSNEAEILYLGIPEENDPNFSVSSLAATSCHELQHLVNFSTKTLPRIGQAEPPVETVALNEGLSHLAEDLCGYNRLGGNLVFAARFLERPQEVSLTGLDVLGRADSMERRGAAYLFLRYLFEQAGAMSFSPEAKLIDKGGIGFLTKLVKSSETGIDNIAARFGKSSHELLWQWWWTLRLSQQGIRQFAYQPLMKDPTTQEWQGVNPFAGVIAITDGFSVDLHGPAETRLEDLLDSKLPGQAVSFLRPKKRLAIPVATTVQIMRTGY